MGYAFMTGPCFICGSLFMFNPLKVPSVRDSNGVRQQVCQGCIARANVIRKKNGLEPLTYPKDAYTACDEVELP